MLAFVEMSREHIPEAVELIRRAMTLDSATWSQRTFDFHFFCTAHGRSDGRKYFLALDQGQIIGMIGWHHYSWGPDDAIWGGWFAVDPAHQGGGAAPFMLGNLALEALKAGYRRIFIETYNSDEYARARRFYDKMGMRLAGRIDSYIRPSVDMVVYAANCHEMDWDRLAAAIGPEKVKECKRLAASPRERIRGHGSADTPSAHEPEPAASRA